MLSSRLYVQRGSSKRLLYFHVKVGVVIFKIYELHQCPCGRQISTGADVVIMEDFPRNVAGKTLKRVMRDNYGKDPG